MNDPRFFFVMVVVGAVFYGATLGLLLAHLIWGD